MTIPGFIGDRVGKDPDRGGRLLLDVSGTGGRGHHRLVGGLVGGQGGGGGRGLAVDGLAQSITFEFGRFFMTGSQKVVCCG